MRDPFAKLFVHLVWATWDRLPLLTPDIRPRVYRCIAAEAYRLGAQAIAIGGIADHVHVLLRYPPAVTISELVKQMKGVSSRLVQRAITPDDSSNGRAATAHSPSPTATLRWSAATSIARKNITAPAA